MIPPFVVAPRDVPVPPEIAPEAAAPSRLALRLSTLLARAWERGLLPPPTLDAGALMAAAARAERLDDFGAETGWRERLDVLLASLAGEAALNPLGRTIAHGQVVKLLRDRLRAVRLWREHPEIDERPVRAPIVILGQMRSGTTRLHRLLACDPRFAHTRCFEAMTPIPRGLPDLRGLRVAAGLRLLEALNPALATIHPTSASAPEEEYGLLAFSISGAQFEAQWRVPSFTRTCEGDDGVALYAEFHRLLRTIRWTRGEPDLPWLLKAPQFMQDLPALLREFPDARLLCLSRDPAAVAASSASLVWQQMRLQSDAVDRRAVGAEWLRKIALRQQRADATRARHRHVPQLEVDYDAVGRDWPVEVARIYDFLGLAPLPEVTGRMEAFMRRSREAPHHAHRYSAEEFGLERAETEEVT